MKRTETAAATSGELKQWALRRWENEGGRTRQYRTVGLHPIAQPNSPGQTGFGQARRSRPSGFVKHAVSRTANAEQKQN
jgi:hypothetical protein